MRCKGLTLLELLVALSVATILLTVAIPGFANWLAQNRLRTASYDLLTDIQLARGEAVKRAVRVGLDTTDNDWNTGWEVFVDDNGDGGRDGGEILLFKREAVSGAISISTNGSMSSMISYVPAGDARQPNGAFQAGTLTLCADDLDKAYQIVISRGGRARMTSQANSSAVCI